MEGGDYEVCVLEHRRMPTGVQAAAGARCWDVLCRRGRGQGARTCGAGGVRARCGDVWCMRGAAVNNAGANTGIVTGGL